MTKQFTKLMSIITIILTFSITPVFAAQAPEPDGLSAILIEEVTGKVLYEKEADLKIYPASMTKILTAVVMMEHIGLDEIVVVGPEVYEVPSDSSKAGHREGESISGANLLRALMMRSGNETGCIIAANVARKVSGDLTMDYKECEKYFCDLLNQKAKELGALNTNFTNPHGYHDSNHYTTARDMAIFSKAALDNPDIAAIVKEPYFEGNGVGTGAASAMRTYNYDWKNTNELIIPGSNYFYEFATGLKTGHTDQSGKCLASSGEKDGKKLIAIICGSEDPKRWTESVKLLKFGFDNYDYKSIGFDGALFTEVEVQVYNPKLEEKKELEVKALGTYTGFFSEQEYNSIVYEVVYDESLIHVPSETDAEGTSVAPGVIQLDLPVKEGDVLGYVIYTLNDEVIFTSQLVSTRTADPRTKETDRAYYIELIKANMFTAKAIPFWAIGIIIIVAIVALVVAIVSARRNRRYGRNFKRRY